ncbi:fatty-acid amide hydrolase 2-A-like isoform X2 [Frankliniella occidentalis]|uniref:Fatty-acid amide hydrolase 2-A-like isoform X2 n=1 Tax=Frankliniella occidentalis TaxID=133901 RepID=A0A6J1TB77_FRAOC|nr:fatty-acid amide hydrolase 2-A-like isoform X2 [Frankliniella occidentalis]
MPVGSRKLSTRAVGIQAGANHPVCDRDCDSVANMTDEVSCSPTTFTSRWLRWLIYSLIWLLGVLVVRPFTFISFVTKPRSRRVPALDNPILTMKASSIAAAIRTRKLRAEDVVAAFVERIKAVNPVVNAVVDQRFADAMQDARDIDAKLDAGDESIADMPLLGVPFTVKESIAVKGLSFRGGQPVRDGEERCAREDAPSVARLRAAGAVPLCVTNTPESCLWWESYNAYTGSTLNPYDTRLTAGGSSGGEGALLGSAASIMGLGSDIAGSCRLPAFFCGVAGHKPTPAVVPWKGHAPECDDPRWPNFFTQAPMARYVSDLPLALKVLAGDKAPQLRLDEKVDLRSVRVYYIESEPSSACSDRVGAEVRAAMARAVQHLRARGLDVQPLQLAGLEDAFGSAAIAMLQLRRVHTVHYDPARPDSMHRAWPELWRFLTCRSRSTLHSVIAGVLFAIATRTPERLVRAADAHRTALGARLEAALGTDAVLLYPSLPEPAHRIGLFWCKLLNSSYLMVFNALGLPVTQVPLGLGQSGRPVGLQVAANKYQDRLSLTIGQELEAAFGGWVPPPSKE